MEMSRRKKDTVERNQGKKVEDIPSSPEMYHYVALTPDGLYHVQNIVGTMIGQHHVHSEQGYVKWRKNFDMNHLLMERADSGCPGRHGSI